MSSACKISVLLNCFQVILPALEGFPKLMYLYELVWSYPANYRTSLKRL